MSDALKPEAAGTWRPLWVRFLYVVLTGAGLCGVALIALIGRLLYGPLDVTPLMARYFPISIERSQTAGVPAGRLSARKMRIGWVWANDGLPSGLGVWSDDLVILGKNGDQLVTAQHAYMRMLPRYLLKKRFRPVELVADHGIVRLRLFKDGDLDLDWPDARRHLYPIPPFSLQFLHRLDVEHVLVRLLNERSGQSLTLNDARTHLARPYSRNYNLSWRGGVKADLAINDRPSGQVEATASSKPEGSDWAYAIRLDTLKNLMNLASDLKNWDVPVSIEGSIKIRTRGQALFTVPTTKVRVAGSTSELRLGQGRIHQNGGADLSISGGRASVVVSNAPMSTDAPSSRLSAARGVASVSSGGDANQPHVLLRVTNLELGIKGDSGRVYDLHADGDLHMDHLLDPHVMKGTVEMAFPAAITMRDLVRIWPVAFLHPVREWVAQSLPEGIARGLDTTIGVASQEGPGHLDIMSLTGVWHVRDATLVWRRPVPPGIGVDADLMIKDRNALDISFIRGEQTSHVVTPGTAKTRRQTPLRRGQSVSLKGGHMRISGLFDRTQWADLALHLFGDLSGYINVLSEPALKLLKDGPLPFSHPAGEVDARVDMHFPLEGADKPDAFQIRAAANFCDVTLQQLALGQSVSKARGQLVATQHSMRLNAEGLFAGMPTSARAQLDFTAHPPAGVTDAFQSSTIVSPQILTKFWPSAPAWLSGQPVLKTRYAARTDGSARLETSVDLQDARVTTPLWLKAYGAPAHLDATLLFQGKTLSEIEKLSAEGDGLSVQGWGQTTRGLISTIVLTKLQLGETLGRARIIFPVAPTTPTDVHAELSALDLTPALRLMHIAEAGKSGASRSSQTGFERDAPWQASVTAQDVLYQQRLLYQTARVTSSGHAGMLDHATFFVKDPSPASAVLEPRDAGAHLRIKVQNLGMHVRRLTGYDRLQNGDLVFDGKTEAPIRGTVPTVKGDLDIGAFSVRNPPAILRALAHAALVDWDKTSIQRFELDRLHAKIEVNQDIVKIADGYFGNRALGATMRGDVELRRKRVDIRGTVVPAFGLNAILGRFPNIGRLFSPEKEGGVFAATYTITGPFEKLRFETNPFSVFLPGVIRSLNE